MAYFSLLTDLLSLSSLRLIAAGLCFGAGAILLLISSIGILRFPDFFTRMHAASVGDTLGCQLIVLGLIFYHGVSILSGKLLLLIAILFVVNPTVCHALASMVLIGRRKTQETVKEE